MGLILFFIAKAAAWGIISYGAPRLLVALGVPLDQWIVAVGGWLSIRMNRQMALWSATVLVGIALYGGAILLSPNHDVFPVLPTVSNKPPPPPGSSRPSGPKQYTERTARELAALFVGRTPLQANKLIEGEVGKWLKVRGEFNNAYQSNSQGDSSVFIQDGRSAMIQCAFSARWTDQIDKLNRGDPISVEGQIIGAQLGNPFWLVKCEFD
jgi:hypothetical protein